MNLDLVLRFVHGMITGACGALLIYKVYQIKHLKRQKEIMYHALESISHCKHFDYDPDASIPDDYDDLKTFCLAARSTNRRLVGDANMALMEIERMDGWDN